MNPHRVKRDDPMRAWHVLEREAFSVDTASGFFGTLNTYPEVLKEYMNGEQTQNDQAEIHSKGIVPQL